MSTVQPFSFLFSPTKSSVAEQTAVFDRQLERKLYCEVATAMKGAKLDDAVVAIYSYRPERDLPGTGSGRKNRRKYTFPG